MAALPAGRGPRVVAGAFLKSNSPTPRIVPKPMRLPTGGSHNAAPFPIREIMVGGYTPVDTEELP
jgi:hypothetical protein